MAPSSADMDSPSQGVSPNDATKATPTTAAIPMRSGPTVLVVLDSSTYPRNGLSHRYLGTRQPTPETIVITRRPNVYHKGDLDSARLPLCDLSSSSRPTSS